MTQYLSAVHDHRLQITVFSSNIVDFKNLKFVALLLNTIDDPNESHHGLLAKERMNERHENFYLRGSITSCSISCLRPKFM